MNRTEHKKKAEEYLEKAADLIEKNGWRSAEYINALANLAQVHATLSEPGKIGSFL